MSNIPEHILIKLRKTKYNGKKYWKQQIKYKGIPIKLSAEFSAETQQARREWHDIFEVM